MATKAKMKAKRVRKARVAGRRTVARARATAKRMVARAKR